MITHQRLLASLEGLTSRRLVRQGGWFAWILPVMADVTGGELDECTRIIDAMWEMEVANRGYERQADHAAGMLLSGSMLQAVAPGEILDLVNRAIQVGYMAALKDIQKGLLDDDILQWRPDLAEG